MTQEDKNLLLKDLCSRLPYGVKIFNNSFGGVDAFNLVGCDGEELIDDEGYWYMIEDCKPFLFPLSSMSEEQKQEYTYIVNYISPDDTNNWKEGEFIYVEQFTQLMYFYLVNHLDYMGLIPQGLANDATGLNIY